MSEVAEVRAVATAAHWPDRFCRGRAAGGLSLIAISWAMAARPSALYGDPLYFSPSPPRAIRSRTPRRWPS
ncbi:hypothetical protein [Streptomyces sp. NPDC007984]|uniref:hypothetical protein n=1 Tax=Streptomyces sp. NPDC007984 TaxID=3364801 RepID=UPI0036ED59BD